jgi:hypothetical protein
MFFRKISRNVMHIIAEIGIDDVFLRGSKANFEESFV